MASLLSTAISIFSIICMWLVFEKAGEPGWQALIPVWNAWVLAKIAKKKWTFWVQTLGAFIMMGAILVATFSALSTITYASNPFNSYDYYDDYEYYDDYDYGDYENDLSFSDLSHTASVNNIQNLRGGVHTEGELTEEDIATLDEFLDVMLESTSIFGLLFTALFLPFILTLPLIAVNFCQQVGLAKAFGQHWAFAFLLTFISPVGMGILAFSPDIQYVGDEDAPYAPNPSPAAAAAAYSAADYRPVEPVAPAQPAPNNDYHAPGYQSTDYNPFEPSSNARVAPDVSEMPLRQQDTIPQVKHRCPNCGFESDRVPNPDTFCPNCGYLYRA